MSWCMNMVPCYISKYHGIATEYYCICPSSELYEQYESMIPDHSHMVPFFKHVIIFLDILYTYALKLPSRHCSLVLFIKKSPFRTQQNVHGNPNTPRRKDLE